MDAAACLSAALGSHTGVEVNEDEAYVYELTTAALVMANKLLPVEIYIHGLRMLQHLQDFRKRFAVVRQVTVVSLYDLALEDSTTAIDYSVVSAINSKANNKHRRSLLMLATDNSRNQAAMETSNIIGKVTGEEGNPSPESDSSSMSDTNSGASSWSSETYFGSSSEDSDYVRFMNNRDDRDDMGNFINTCKEYVADLKMANGEVMPSHQGKGLLLLEHNILCEAFLIVISYSGRHQYEEILLCLLRPLNKIWTLPEWRSKYLHGVRLTCLFSETPFLRMVYYMIRFCEEELKRSKLEELTALKSHELYIVTLSQSILPLLLELIQSIHGLWFAPYADYLSEELQRAKYPGPDYLENEEGSQERETRALLEGIRESGYHVIGLCASIEGAFSNLNGLSLSVALSKYLFSLEFRHLRKLIRLTIIPLVKNFPCKFWKDLVEKLLRHCENILHCTWFGLLCDGCPRSPYYFGKLSGFEETIKTLEWDILLEFTREVSGLLEVLALAEQNIALSQEDVTHYNQTISLQDIDSMPYTLLRYLVIHDCFGSLRMSLFGYFVDDTATAKAIPFCRALICLAVASNDAKIRIFILDNLLPCLIQRLDNQLPCAIQSLKCELGDKLSSSGSNTVNRDLVVLCQELYGYMLKSGYVQTQVLADEDKNGDDTENSFNDWLERQKKHFQVKAYSAAARKLPKGYRWNWEFEDECQIYLSTYIDIFQEVDAIDDFAEHFYTDKESLFQKLSPAFRSKYAINSCVHPYMTTISSIQRRKYVSMAAVLRNRKICKFVCKLIELKPYIKASDYSRDVINRLKQTFEIPAEYVEPSVELLHSILYFWEPRFHPMIRESHMDKLLGILDGLTRSQYLQPLAPIIRDFPNHLQPYARTFIETKLKESKYYVAKEQIHLHEEFDKYLASGDLDDRMDLFMSSKDDFVEDLVANELVPHQFLVLESSLIKLSLERRAEVVNMRNEACTYAEFLQRLLECQPLKLRAKSLIIELENEGFFNVDSYRVKLSSEILDNFSFEFSRNSLPKHYAIRALIDCRTILLQKDICWQEAFKKIVADVCNDLTGYLPKFWNDTRYYEHQYYAISRDPLKQVILGVP